MDRNEIAFHLMKRNPGLTREGALGLLTQREDWMVESFLSACPRCLRLYKNTQHLSCPRCEIN